jgi:hypothetical protein
LKPADASFALIEAYRIVIPRRGLPLKPWSAGLVGDQTGAVKKKLAEDATARAGAYEQAIKVGKAARSPKRKIKRESDISNQLGAFFGHD